MGVFVGFSRIFLLGILIFKGLTVRRLYKSFGFKGLVNVKVFVQVSYTQVFFLRQPYFHNSLRIINFTSLLSEYPMKPIGKSFCTSHNSNKNINMVDQLKATFCA
jgi:hypothetical protein